MTIQSIQDDIYALVSAESVRSVTINGTTQTYALLLTNEADTGVTEPYMRVDINASRKPYVFDDSTYQVDVNVTIFDQPDQAVGSAYARVLADQIENAIYGNVPMSEFDGSNFEVVGYSDEQENFTHTYTISFAT